MTDATTSGMNRSSSGASAVKEELSGDAERLKDTAKQRAEQEANTRKGNATNAAHSTSSALGKAAEQLRNDENAPSWLSSAFEKTAKEIDHFAGRLENKDAGEIRRDVADFARQSPTAFLAASALAGFAAARFMRAGSEYQSHHRSDGKSAGQGGPAPRGTQQFGGASTGSGSWNPDSPVRTTSREGARL